MPSVRAVSLLALLGACTVEAKPAPAKRAEPSHFLGETFQLGAAECQLRRALPALTEPRVHPVGRPPEDIAVVALELACTPERAASLRALWIDDAGAEHALSTRTALQQRAPELLVFEVARQDAGVSSARRYDAKTGEPRGLREHRRARLIVEDAGQSVVIAPFLRQAEALDALVDQLARTLASGASGDAELRAAAELYQRVQARSDQLVVRTNPPRLALALERANGEPVASFELVLDPGASRVLRAYGVEASRVSVQCADDAASLHERVQKLAPRDGDCNALGTLLPGRCAEHAPALLRDALRVASQCELDPALGLDLHAAEPPADFELLLRRARTSELMEQSPHYRLQIKRTGRVLFDGQEHVGSLGLHEGRTSSAMIAALAERFTRMAWLKKKDGEICHAADDRGDVIEVRMGGRIRQLRDRDGCRGGFTAQELELTRTAIERAVGVGAWLDQPAASTPRATRDTEVWVVAAE